MFLEQGPVRFLKNLGTTAKRIVLLYKHGRHFDDFEFQ